MYLVEEQVNKHIEFEDFGMAKGWWVDIEVEGDHGIEEETEQKVEDVEYIGYDEGQAEAVGG